MAMHSIRCGTGYRHCQLNLLWFRERRARAAEPCCPGPEHHHPCRGGQQGQLGHEHSGHRGAHDRMQSVGVGLGGQTRAAGIRPAGSRSSTR